MSNNILKITFDASTIKGVISTDVNYSPNMSNPQLYNSFPNILFIPSIKLSNSLFDKNLGEDDIKKMVPEGIVGRVPYKGELEESMTQFIGGLRAGMGYCGSKDILTLKESAKFIRITASGIYESHPHNVTITKEAPNYSRI